MRYSSKYLNLEALDLVVRANPTTDCVIITTSAGIVIGELCLEIAENIEDSTSLRDMVLYAKEKLMNSDVFQDVELIGDGSTILLKNAIILFDNKVRFNMNQYVVHCDDIVGFSASNRQDLMKQLNLQ